MRNGDKIILKELPDSIKPRERLIEKGPNALNDYELLAIILRTGSNELSVLDLAKYMIVTEGDIGEFNDITIEELKKYKGVKVAKAVEIVAAIEFGKRVASYTKHKVKIYNSLDIYEHVRYDLENLTKEVCKVIFLNIKGEIIIIKDIESGDINSVSIDYIKIIEWAIRYSSKNIAIVHNHPSGDPTPSVNDKLFTQTLTKKAALLGINLVDHVIIGKNKYYSFLETRLREVLDDEIN